MEAANVVPCFQVRYTNLAYRHFAEMTNYSTFLKHLWKSKKKKKNYCGTTHTIPSLPGSFL